MKIEIDALCKFTAKADAVMENQSYYCSMAEKEIARGVKKAYAAVVGQDDYVVLVTYDDHFEKNALERGFVFADDAVQVIIQYLENNYTLADMILEAEDVGYKKNKSHGTVAIHFQKAVTPTNDYLTREVMVKMHADPMNLKVVELVGNPS